MVKIIFYLLVPFFLISCKDNLEKKVYYDFKLGRSFDFNKKRLKTLCDSGIFLLNKDNYPYVEHTINQGKYFSTPYFLTIPGDTIVAEIQVMYLTDVNDLRLDLDGMENNSRVMNIPLFSDGGLTPELIKEDILNNLNKKYGNFNSIDTLRPININGYKLLYNWKGKDGVNIELNYLFDKSFDYRTSILLKYNYIEEIKNKLIKQSNVY